MTEKKRLLCNSINAINDERLLNIVVRLVYGILKNDDSKTAGIMKKAVERARNGK